MNGSYGRGGPSHTGLWVCVPAVALLVMLLPFMTSASTVPCDTEASPIPQVSIEVDVDEWDLGAMYPGDASDITVNVNNTGSCTAEVHATVDEQGGSALLSTGITVNGDPWQEFSESIPVDGGCEAVLRLEIPADCTSYGPVNGSVSFWARGNLGEADGDDWSQWMKDDGHSAVQTGDGAVIEPSLNWTYDAGGDGHGIDVIPLIVDDTVFILDAFGYLHAVDLLSGGSLWVCDTGERSMLQTSIPAYGDGKVFIASSGGSVMAVNALSGERLWSFDLDDERKGFECPVLYLDGRIYVGEGLGGGVGTKYYYCLDTDGELVWEYAAENTSGFIWSGAAVCDGHVIIPLFEGTLVSLDAANGTVTDTVDLTDDEDIPFAREDLGRIRSSLTYSEGYVYASTEKNNSHGFLFRVGFANGSFTEDGWSVQTGFSTSTPAVHGGRVYLGSGEHGAPSGALLCIDADDGSVIWSHGTASGVKSSPALYDADGSLYVYFTVQSGYDCCAVCLDGNGTLVWEFNPEDDDSYILQGLALGTERALFGTGDGMLYCLIDDD